MDLGIGIASRCVFMRPARQTGKETSCTSRRRGRRRHHTGRSGARPSPSAARSQSKGRSRDVNKATRENCARTRTTRTSHKTNERTNERTNREAVVRNRSKSLRSPRVGSRLHACGVCAAHDSVRSLPLCARFSRQLDLARSLAERNCLSQITILRSVVRRSTVDSFKEQNLNAADPTFRCSREIYAQGGREGRRSGIAIPRPTRCLPAVPAVPEL